MTKLAAESILYKSPSYGSEVLVEQRFGEEMDTSCVKDNCIIGLENRNDVSSKKETHSPTKGFLDLASRLGHATAKYGLLVLGALVMELVMLLSVRPNEGLFLILPTLAVGTSVYILDAKKDWDIVQTPLAMATPPETSTRVWIPSVESYGQFMNEQPFPHEEYCKNPYVGRFSNPYRLC